MQAPLPRAQDSGSRRTSNRVDQEMPQSPMRLRRRQLLGASSSALAGRGRFRIAYPNLRYSHRRREAKTKSGGAGRPLRSLQEPHLFSSDPMGRSNDPVDQFMDPLDHSNAKRSL